MGLTWPSVLQAMESSVEIICKSSEYLIEPSEIMIFNVFPSSNMRVAFLDLSIENQKGGYVKSNQIKLLKNNFPLVAPLLSPSGILSSLGSLLSVSSTAFSTFPPQ